MIYNIFVIQDVARYVSTGGIFRMYIYGYTFDGIFETPQCDVSTTLLYAGHRSAVTSAAVASVQWVTPTGATDGYGVDTPTAFIAYLYRNASNWRKKISS